MHDEGMLGQALSEPIQTELQHLQQTDLIEVYENNVGGLLTHWNFFKGERQQWFMEHCLTLITSHQCHFPHVHQYDLLSQGWALANWIKSHFTWLKTKWIFEG